MKPCLLILWIYFKIWWCGNKTRKSMKKFQLDFQGFRQIRLFFGIHKVHAQRYVRHQQVHCHHTDGMKKSKHILYRSKKMLHKKIKNHSWLKKWNVPLRSNNIHSFYLPNVSWDVPRRSKKFFWSVFILLWHSANHLL